MKQLNQQGIRQLITLKKVAYWVGGGFTPAPDENSRTHVFVSEWSRKDEEVDVPKLNIEQEIRLFLGMYQYENIELFMKRIPYLIPFLLEYEWWEKQDGLDTNTYL